MESKPHNHTYMSRQNLADISHYARGTLDSLERGAGELPQWVNHLVSETRTHMQDVGHYLREQARLGRRFGSGSAPWYGIAGLQPPGGKVYSGHEPGHVSKGPSAHMARKNLREIAQYADESTEVLKANSGIFPAWIEHKLSVAAQNMDTVGHYLDNEGEEGRKYGSGIPGDAGDVAYFYGIADGMGGRHKPEQWSEAFQLKIYEQGWREGNQQKNDPESQPKRARCYGLADARMQRYNDRWAKTPYKHIYDAAFEEVNGRRFAGKGGAGRGASGRGGPRGGARAGGGRPASASSGRPGAPTRGGRGQHPRRHKQKHPTYVYPAWGYPYHPWWGHLGYYPAPIDVEKEYEIPAVKHVYSHKVKRQLMPEISDSHGVIGMTGSGFGYVPDVLVIRYRIGTGEWRIDRAPILSRSDGSLEFAVPVSASVLPGFALGDIGFYVNGDIVSFAGSFFANLPRPWNPFAKRRRYGVVKGKKKGKKGRGRGRQYCSDMGSPRRYAAPDSSIPPEFTHDFHPPEPSGPLMPSNVMVTFPPSRMLEDHRSVNWSRMMEEPTNRRRYGVPGHPYGTPGWAGAGGVAQRPLAAIRGGAMQNRPVRGDGSMGDVSMGDGSMDMAIQGRRFAEVRTFGPGLNAGQAGVETLGGRAGARGPIGVQTYGSLGYASMGDGSMDMAIRGSRR